MKKGDAIFFGFVLVLNIVLIGLRIKAGTPAITGDLFSTALFIVLFLTLITLFFFKKYEYYIIVWCSVYFALSLIKVSDFSIGSLGLLNVVFIPLMLLTLCNPRDKYFLIIILISIISLFNPAAVGSRLIVSRIFQFIAPFVFFLFVARKCKNRSLIMKGLIFVVLLNSFLVFYELIYTPVWGVLSDWRGVRVFGNLFHPNNYSIYLLPVILLSYFYLRTKPDKKNFLLFSGLLLIDFLTGSRSGILSLVFGLLIFEILFIKNKKAFMKVFFLLAISILFLLLFFINQDSINQHLSVSSIGERTTIWASYLPFVRNNLLFGNGVGSYELYRDQILLNLASHSYYLGTIFEIGIVGLLVIFTFLLNLFFGLIKQMRLKQNRELAALGISVLVGLLVYSTADNGAFLEVVSLNAWCLLGTCLVLNKEKQVRTGEKNE